MSAFTASLALIYLVNHRKLVRSYVSFWKHVEFVESTFARHLSAIKETRCWQHVRSFKQQNLRDTFPLFISLSFSSSFLVSYSTWTKRRCRPNAENVHYLLVSYLDG